MEITETGAIRSADLKKERWDLISVRALNRLSQYTYLNASINVAELTGFSLQHIYNYLWGCRSIDHLGLGMRDLAIACQLFCCEGCCSPKSITDRRLWSSLPYHPLHLLAETCNEGMIKYGHHNWLLGFPIETLLNHGIRHIVKIINGNEEENHWGHALWAYMAAIHMEETRPDMCINLLGLNGTLTDSLKQQLEEHHGRIKKAD